MLINDIMLFMLAANITKLLKDCPDQKCSERNITNDAPRICQCDEDCHQYGDCCSDMARPTDFWQKLKGIDRRYWECTRNRYLVTRCPEGHELASLCNGRTQFPGILSYAVFDPVKKVVFQNFFCAKCHGPTADLEPVQVQLQCYRNITSEINETVAYSNFIDDGTCSVNTKNLKNMGRECYTTYSDCPNPNTLVARKCRSYSATVGVGWIFNKLYKNPHCAACLGVKEDEVGCYPGSGDVHYSPAGVPSYSILLDISWKMETCKGAESVWDVLSRRCVELREELVEEDNTLQGWLTEGCLSLSVTCLLVHLSRQGGGAPPGLPTKLNTSLAFSLLLLQAGFLVAPEPPFHLPPLLCRLLATALYFACLSTVFWMNAVSWDLWRTFSTFRQRRSTPSSYFKFALYGWVLPFLLALLTLAADYFLPDDFRPKFAERPGLCWFANRRALTLYLFFPTSLLVLADLLLFILTVHWLHDKVNNKTLKGNATGRKHYKRFLLYVKCFAIMGLTWVTAILATFFDNPIFWYPFIVLTGLQGVFIFLIFDLKEIRKLKYFINYLPCLQKSPASAS